MLREELDSLAVAGVRKLLGTHARPITIETARRNGAVVAKLPFAPSGCIRCGDNYYLVEATDVAPIPERIIRATACLRPKTQIILVTNPSPDASAAKIAAQLAGAVVEHGFGLAMLLGNDVQEVFPPDFIVPTIEAAATEFGHIPSWLITEIAGGTGFSDHFAACVRTFVERYRALVTDEAPTFDDEFAVLFEFATKLTEGDRRLHWPLGQLQMLKELERQKANPKARDHVFHTFNNLILGAVILAELMRERHESLPPENIIRSSPGGLAAWEVLWLFTCLFHDPGYLGEKFGPSVNFTFGFHGLADPEMEMPDVIVRRLEDAWDTELAPARHDLKSLFQELAGVWAPLRANSSIWAKFDSALRVAYFDGRRGIHSLLSGLRLIELCLKPGGRQHSAYDATITQKTSVIAALGMLFHDERCRRIFTDHGILPVPFERLPYAATLMFVDALQEDRRDIELAEFPASGFLVSVTVDALTKHIAARINLAPLPLEWWPFKIAEMAGVVRWINSQSEMQVAIDYQTLSGNGFPK